MKSLPSIRSKLHYVFLTALLILFAAAAVACIVRPRKISTSFTSMIPQGGVSDSMLRAETAFTEGQNSNVNIFVSGGDFQTVKNKAIQIFPLLEGCGAFESISIESSALDTEELFSMVSDNVYRLLDAETRSRIKADPRSFQDDSLARIFSAFTISSLLLYSSSSLTHEGPISTVSAVSMTKYLAKFFFIGSYLISVALPEAS